MTTGKATLAPLENLTYKCQDDTQALRVLGLASKSIHLNFRLMWGQVVNYCFKCRCNNYKFILLLAACLDAFIAISEDLNLKISRAGGGGGACHRTPLV